MIYLIARALLVGIGYYIFATLGATYTVVDVGISVLWPANAVLLAAFLIFPPRQWPLMALMTLGAEVLVGLSFTPVSASLAFGLINIFEVTLAAWLIRRSTAGEFDFDRVASATRFLVFGPVLASCLAGLLGAWVYVWLGQDISGYWSLWRLWWFGDALGLLLMTPLLVALWRFMGRGMPAFRPWRLLELGTLWGALLLVAPVAFRDWSGDAFDFNLTPIVILPLGIWAAIRFGVLVTVTTLVVIATLAIRYLVNEVYPIGSSSPQEAVWAVQEFLAIVAIVSVGLSVLLAEIRQQNAGLEKRIQERTSSLAQANAELNATNEWLRSLVSTDFLTGIANRRAFDENGERILQQMKREQSPVSAIMFDLDHFKKINDVLGHDAGDQVLRDIIAPVISVLRPLDLFCRYGGEEFLVLLPGADLNEAAGIAERIRQTIADLEVQYKEEVVRVTVSLGAAEWDGVQHLDELVHAADKALYAAKHSGRNCVRLTDNGIIHSSALT
ncbi:GGDEF domain-containing protein [Pseudohongiella sp.]|uniref:GGDEF domain-containing protein n=1 Tax=marine sediment metagenome TaxID=412755 RepID=A0A0F9Z5J7_9ZZZZ|nr:diguanylate cyclase [Pseudohongiella sp.]HDZ07670.1 sensor domain-containing diguanylate cyclase [Pseudohongiella sp.]HEA63250.1 sensor domain-containing diguanylate cyclase [Pseudohongiella sp.]